MEVTDQIKQVFRVLKKLGQNATRTQRRYLLRETTSLKRRLEREPITPSKQPSTRSATPPPPEASLVTAAPPAPPTPPTSDIPPTPSLSQSPDSTVEAALSPLLQPLSRAASLASALAKSTIPSHEELQEQLNAHDDTTTPHEIAQEGSDGGASDIRHSIDKGGPAIAPPIPHSPQNSAIDEQLSEDDNLLPDVPAFTLRSSPCVLGVSAVASSFCAGATTPPADSPPDLPRAETQSSLPQIRSTDVDYLKSTGMIFGESRSCCESGRETVLRDAPSEREAMETSRKRKVIPLTSCCTSSKRARIEVETPFISKNLPYLSEICRTLSLEPQQERQLHAIETVKTRLLLVELLPVLADVASARSLQRLRDALNQYSQMQMQMRVDDIPSLCRDARHAASLSLRGRVIYRSLAVLLFDRIWPWIDRLSTLKAARRDLIIHARRARRRCEERVDQVQRIEQEILRISPGVPVDSTRTAKEIVLNEQAWRNCNEPSRPDHDIDAEASDIWNLYNVGQRFGPLNRSVMPFISYLWPDDDESEQKARLVSTRLEQDPTYADVAVQILYILMPGMSPPLVGNMSTRIEHAFRAGDTSCLILQTMTNDQIANCSKDLEAFGKIFNQVSAQPRRAHEAQIATSLPFSKQQQSCPVDEARLIEFSPQQTSEDPELHTTDSSALQQQRPCAHGQYAAPEFDWLHGRIPESEGSHSDAPPASQRQSCAQVDSQTPTFDWPRGQPQEGRGPHSDGLAFPQQQPCAQADSQALAIDWPHGQPQEGEGPYSDGSAFPQQPLCTQADSQALTMDWPRGQPQEGLGHHSDGLAFPQQQYCAQADSQAPTFDWPRGQSNHPPLSRWQQQRCDPTEYCLPTDDLVLPQATHDVPSAEALFSTVQQFQQPQQPHLQGLDPLQPLSFRQFQERYEQELISLQSSTHQLPHPQESNQHYAVENGAVFLEAGTQGLPCDPPLFNTSCAYADTGTLIKSYQRQPVLVDRT